MTSKKARIFGGKPIVQQYEFDEAQLHNKDLNILIFEKPTKEWAEFVFKNRSRNTTPFRHKYDIVIGPIADDGVAYLLSRYEEGSYTLDDLVKGLEYKKLNNQLFFGTQRAIKLLRRVKWHKHN